MCRTTASAACSTFPRRRSCCRTPTPSALCDHPRNAPDDVLKRLKANGGAVLATFVPGFVSQALRNWLRGSLDAHGKAPLVADPKARHRRRSKRATARRRARRWPRSPTRSSIWSRRPASIMSASAPTSTAAPQPQGLEHVGRFPHLFAELIRRGFSERDLEKIAHRNILRVMRKVEQVGETLTGNARAGGGPDRGLSGAVRRASPQGLTASSGASSFVKSCQATSSDVKPWNGIGHYESTACGASRAAKTSIESSSIDPISPFRSVRRSRVGVEGERRTVLVCSVGARDELPKNREAVG